MRVETGSCQSCGMTIESGPYCEYCVNGRGELQDFEERLERMQQFAKQRNPSLDGAALLASTLDYMATMPAWREHPRVVNR